jgi:hypothetical protein
MTITRGATDRNVFRHGIIVLVYREEGIGITSGSSAGHQNCCFNELTQIFRWTRVGPMTIRNSLNRAVHTHHHAQAEAMLLQ